MKELYKEVTKLLYKANKAYDKAALALHEDSSEDNFNPLAYFKTNQEKLKIECAEARARVAALKEVRQLIKNRMTEES